MSWTLVQTTGLQTPTNNVSSISATFGSAVTANNLVVAVVSLHGGNAVTVQDSVNGVNYSGGVLYIPGFGVAIYYSQPATGGTGFAVTASFTNPVGPGIAIFEFAVPAGQVVSLDGSAVTATATSTTAATAAISPTTSDLVIAAASFGGSVSPTVNSIGGGFSSGYQGNSSSNSNGLTVEYALNQSSSITPSIVYNTSTQWAMAGLAFKSAAPVPLISLVPYITKNGLFAIGVTNPAGTAVSNITSLGTAPSLFVNSSAATLYGPVWDDADKDLPLVTYQVTSPSSIAPTDVVTYTIPKNGIVTALGGNLAVSSQAAVANYVGQLEPGFGGLSSFVPNRRMQVGVNLGGQSWAYYGAQNVSKNRRRVMYFSAFSGGAVVTYDLVNDPTQVVSWTNPSTGILTSPLADYLNSNGIETASGQVGYPVAQGQWAIQFKDVNATNATDALKIWIVGNPLTCVGSDTEAGGFNGVAGSTAVRTVGTDGQTVTITYQLSYPNWPTLNTAHGYNMALHIYCKSAVGLWASGNTITDFWVFAPGDEDMDTSNPLAISNTLKASLTAPNGNGPAIIRALDTIAPAGYGNFRDFSDCQNINAFGWAGGIPNPPIPISSVRFYNTNPNLDNVSGDSTYGWAASTKVYDPLLGFDGTDATGPYLDLSLRPGQGGEADFGQWLNPHAGQDSYAALEFVSTSPHGLWTGQWLSFPLATATTPTIFPITGSTQTPLSGTVSLTHGNQSVTFSVSQSFPPGNNGLIFGSDTTGNAYYIQNGGSSPITGTTFTMTPQYQGTTAGASTCSTTATVDISNFSQVVHVTGANTFAMACGFTFGITSGTTIQTITSTNQIALNISCTRQALGGTGPYGFYANVASQWEGTKLLVPLMPYMTDACLQSIADEIAVNSLPDATILFELGDEHWNLPGFGTGFATTAYGRLMAFAPPLQAVNSYYSVPTSPGVLGSDAAYTLILAHQHDVIQAQFDTHNKGLHAGRLFSGFWAGSGVASNMIGFGSAAPGSPSTGGLQQRIPMEYISVAPYLNGPGNNTTYKQAWATTGTSPGSWPVALIHDHNRHYHKYNSSEWAFYSSNYGALQTYAGPTGYPGQTAGKPTLIGYEGQVQQLVTTTTLEHDVFYAPQMADTWNAGFGAMQDGSPLVPGSGLALVCIYTFGGEWGNGSNLGDLWSVQVYPSQGGGTGSANLFTTSQGGSPGDGLCHDVSNESPEITQMQNWFGITSQAQSQPGSATLRVSPSRIPPGISTPNVIELTIVGTGTDFTADSVIAITNSIRGTTYVTALTWDPITTTLATLTVTTAPGSGPGTGLWTLTIDGTTSLTLVVAPRQSRWFGGMSRVGRSLRLG